MKPNTLPLDGPPLAYPRMGGIDNPYSPARLVDLPGLSSFLRENSKIPGRPDLPGLPPCTVLWGRPCGHSLCPWCAEEKSRSLRKLWLERINPASTTLYCRLSVESSHSIDLGWDAIARTRRRFGENSWLLKYSDGWVRTTELTERHGLWNWHDNIQLVGDPARLSLLKELIGVRWAEGAASAPARKPDGTYGPEREGIYATPDQYSKFSISTPAVTTYILKTILGYASEPDRGRTPGDLLRDWYTQGDADAGDLWTEIRQFFAARPRSVVLTQKGGIFRGAKTKGDYDLCA